MDSGPDVLDYESRAKRPKIDLDDPNGGELRDGDGFSRFSATIPSPIGHAEGLTTDCDSGYEASNLESIQTHSPQHPDTQESMSNLSASCCPTPTHENNDTSQESLEEEEEEDDDEDDNTSTVSNLSDISGLSNLSGQDWKPMAGSMIWIQQQMQKGMNPRAILTDLGVDLDLIPTYVDDLTLWKIVINVLAEPPRRHKLKHINTLNDVVRLLKGAQKIIVLTGAGVSVSCGIPDFRSRDGIYSRLAKEFPNLPDPQAMFDIGYFSQDPRPFFKFAKDIYPGKFKPSPCHRFIKLLERHCKLLRNYTQNIDTLEKEANIENVIECHGSFATATCTKCDHKVSADKIRNIVLAQKIPMCEVCHENSEISMSTDDSTEQTPDFKSLVMSGIMKPDIVFFGEGLPDTFHESMTADKTECDLLLVIGSSLKVRPVALIPSSLPAHVPQILINREPLSHCHFDVELLGDCDVIINHLCKLLGENWEEGIYSQQQLVEVPELLPEQSEKQFDISKWRGVQGKLSCSDENLLLDSEECEANSSSNQTSGPCILEDKSFKERHTSTDSVARDSGIGENSNFADLETEANTSEKTEKSIFNNMSGKMFEETTKSKIPMPSPTPFRKQPSLRNSNINTRNSQENCAGGGCQSANGAALQRGGSFMENNGRFSQQLRPNSVRIGGKSETNPPTERIRSLSLSLSNTRINSPKSPGTTSMISKKYSSSQLDSWDTDSITSIGSSVASCDHASIARNGTTFSGRSMKYVFHCNQQADVAGEDYLTPTQRAHRQVKKLKYLLQQAKNDLEQKDSDILKLTKEVVELRLYKAALNSPEDKSNSSEAITVREITPDETDNQQPSELLASFADSGHYEDGTNSSIHSNDDYSRSPYKLKLVETSDKSCTAHLSEKTSSEQSKLIMEYEKRIQELVRTHEEDTYHLKQKHNNKIEELLQRITEINARYWDLVPELDIAKDKIRELEIQLELASENLQKHQEKNKEEVENSVMEIARQHPNRVSVPELLTELQVTKNELENIKAMYRQLTEAKSRNKIDPEITLQFLKSAVYYFLTDKENSSGHLKAIQSILGFTANEITNIEKARAT
ncbi:unnamed protein product [Ceutorhynchus assimilis]|uniref:protein acetyllysine N-acetyltransferase n=1 Tax=Ceutorhynchus assimilis TaxID=467358 RepID=A0A9N9MJK8_9CUCU|nr:unnamed protein product [Ceutorhynchus assimilis]